MISRKPMGRNIDYLRKGPYLYIALTQLHRSEEAIPDSYDN